MYQHGFTRKRSIFGERDSTCLLCSANIIESGNQVDVIYRDFGEAFDRVDHQTVIRMIEQIGVQPVHVQHPTTLDCIKSYFTNRFQYEFSYGSQVFSNCFPSLLLLLQK